MLACFVTGMSFPLLFLMNVGLQEMSSKFTVNAPRMLSQWHDSPDSYVNIISMDLEVVFSQLSIITHIVIVALSEECFHVPCFEDVH